jgi:Flp pilus assembly protein TadD
MLIGWMWFLGTLMPVIGLVQVGSQSMADRYLYFPQIGLLWRSCGLFQAFSLVHRSPHRRDCARRRRDDFDGRRARTSHGLAEYGNVVQACHRKSPDNWMMQHLLGLWYLHQKRTDLAAEQFAIAEKLNPGHSEIASNLGDMLALRGQRVQAIEAYRRALDLEPDRHGTLNNYAVILATSADPKLRDGPLAVKLAMRACELTEFKHAGNMFTLAAAYAEAGQFEHAIRTAEQARDLAFKANQTLSPTST